MKHCSRTLICALCTVCVVVCASANPASDLAIDNNRMHDVIKSMLGFKGDPKIPHPLNVAEDAPKYMLDLYELVKDGLSSTSQMKGNTVRSIKATIETINGEPMFVFNMTSLASTREEIIGAEIHLYKRRKEHYNKKSDIEIVLHEIAPHYAKESGKIVVTPEIYGWQWFDVTNVIKGCVTDSRRESNSLGLNFKVSKPHGNSNMLHLKRYIHRHSVPYLIIYSNDSQDIDIEELENLSTASKSSTKLTSEHLINNVDTVLPERTKRNKRSIDDNTADLPIFESRARSMSILTNEIPEDPEDYNRPYPIKVKEIQTHPGMLQTRKESRHKISDPRIIPYPGDYIEKRRKDRRKNKRKKGKGRKDKKLELPKEWEDLREMAEEEKSDNSCSKKKLIVEFSEIGWGEWIISPKSFKSHYCSGTCSFPLTKKMRPSNHATIQSLVNAVGIYPDVPAPCCVPDKLSSITLLYFDENRNVVLKNYPNMTVQKCACR